LKQDTKEIEMMSNQKRALRRSRSDRMLAGVCGGLAQFFGISAFWFRLGMIIAFIPGGVPGILIYLLLWLMIPAE
jgi:phage shock protein PspC (stress-responsive transcriptional regulator)